MTLEELISAVQIFVQSDPDNKVILWAKNSSGESQSAANLHPLDRALFGAELVKSGINQHIDEEGLGGDE